MPYFFNGLEIPPDEAERIAQGVSVEGLNGQGGGFVDRSLVPPEEPAGFSTRAAEAEEVDDEPRFECYDCETEGEERYSWYSEHDSQVRCEGCHYEHEDRMAEYERRDDLGESIHYYSYRPQPLFMDVNWDTEPIAPSRRNSGVRGELYMGFELEVEVNDESRGPIADAFSRAANSRGTVLYLKEDGSLNYGFEIVTHPCTLDYYNAYFPWNEIEKLRSKGVTAWNSRSCGLHIHMSRRAFVNERHLWKFIVFIYKNAEPLIQFAGRSSSYARFSRENFLNFYDFNRNQHSSSTFMKHAKGESRNDDRYTAVNLQPVETIELRFFRPSLRTETVRAALEFCAALHEYTEKLSTKEVLDGALKWPKFRAWVKGKSKYQILDSRIAERFSESADL